MDPKKALFMQALANAGGGDMPPKKKGKGKPAPKGKKGKPAPKKKGK